MPDAGASLEPPRFAADEPAITILHVSDMQFGKHHRFADPDGGFDTLLRRLCDDLDLLREQNGLRPDLIALTGDLAEWGMKREFEQVAVFGEGLLKHLSLDPDRILVVPGNHDINRNLCQSHFLRCAGEGDEPKPPYWPKWEPFLALFNRLYRDVDRYRFTELEPWSLFEIPSLKVVVAGLNSTLHESHREEDHHGYVGEAQLRWFDDRLAEYERKGWLRIGLVHHNAVRRAAVDDENLKDADDLREILGERLHVLLHGHTHQGRLEMLGPSLPVISTGSAAVKRDQRPGPSHDQPGETPNQYQLVRLTRGGLWCAAREYTYERKRWIGDTRVSPRGDRWWYSLDRAWPRADATFPSPAPAAHSGEVPAVTHRRDISELLPGHGHERRRKDDLLDDVIAWCRIGGEGKIAEVTRVHHRGPWGDYAKVHDRERGIGLLGAFDGDLTAEVIDRWIADVHDPFRGRGQAVSKLVLATSLIDPALRAAAQARGVDVERMIDYQRVLDTVGYAAKLRERLDKDREYPPEYYLEQRVTVWSPIQGPGGSVTGAADWLSAHLLEREGTFVLVLGQAGVGKTFLLRQVARRLGDQQAITPILIELRDLERAQTIEELAATQFTRFGVPWHPKAFRRDLEEGRLALLFDGFDELALRVRSAAIPAHFERIYAAAVGRARIVVSSRTEHFLSSGQIADLMTPSSAGTTPLGGLLERVPRRLVLEVHPFERDDVAVYLRRRLGPAAGEARLARLGRVHDLVGLACTPRMVGFLVAIPDDKLEQAAGLGASITSDALYRIVIEESWLAAQAERLRPPGAAPGPTVEALRDAATNLALQLWRDPSGSIQAADVGAHAGGLLARMCEDDPDWAANTARARTLLTRDDRGRISFIHQTVLEWLVAGHLAGEIASDLRSSHLDVGRLNAFMIEVLRQRLGEETLARWAEARLSSPTTGIAAENAREVLQRLNREATGRAVLRDQDLRGQELGGQSLRGGILDGADLTGARLVGRDLSGASLVGAQLAYADFTDAVLQDADLSGANLAFTRFHRADLRGARLTGARLTGASFLGARSIPALDGPHSLGVAREVGWPLEAMFERASRGGGEVAVHPNGTLLASGEADGTIRLWNCSRGQVLRILAGHQGRVWTMAFSPDGRILASGGEDATVRLWNIEDGSERARLAGERWRVSSVAFSPDGQTLASGAGDTVLLWNVADRSERVRLAGHRGTVSSVALSPDGKTLASGDDDAVHLWNVADGRAAARLDGHRRGVNCVTFSPDGELLASGGDDTVRLWSTKDWSERACLRGHHEAVWSVAFSPDGKTLASGAGDATMRLWNVEDVNGWRRVIEHDGAVTSVVFLPDGKTVASADESAVRLWNVESGTIRKRLDAHGESVKSVAFSPDGKTMASATTHTVRLWSTEDWSAHSNIIRYPGGIRAGAFSPDGRVLASAIDDVVWLRDLWGGGELPDLVGHRGRIWSLAFSPDGVTLASGSEDGTVRLWDLVTGSERTRLLGHRGSVWSVAFSPDGKTVASAGTDGTVRLWNAREGNERTKLVGPMVSVAFSPDSELVVSGSEDGTVQIWRASDGRLRTNLDGHRGRVSSLAFSPDGAMLASGAQNATVRLWRAVNGTKHALLLAGHGGPVSSVAFSPDGRMLASGAADATMRLWDVASGRCLAILYGTSEGSVAARLDGRYRVRGDIAGQFWHVIGLHRYDVGELDALVPGLRLADDEPLFTLP